MLICLNNVQRALLAAASQARLLVHGSGAASSQLAMPVAEEMQFYGDDLGLVQTVQSRRSEEEKFGGIWHMVPLYKAQSQPPFTHSNVFSTAGFFLPCSLRTTDVTSRRSRTDLTVPFVFLRTVAAKCCVTPTRLMPSTSTI